MCTSIEVANRWMDNTGMCIDAGCSPLWGFQPSGLFDLNHVDLNHDLNRDLNHLIFFKKITDLNQLL